MPKLLRSAEEYSRMDYPRVGIPLKTDNKSYLLHLIDSESTGKYLKLDDGDIEGSWEVLVNLVANLQKKRKNLMDF